MTQSEFLFSDPDPKPTSAKKVAAPKKTVKPPRVYSVTQLSRMIKIALDENLPKTILLEAEISNFKHHPSGHLYCTLKDADAQVPAVMWKRASSKLKFKPTDGMAVIATGKINVYEPHGKYQFYIDKLEPAGLGALELAFRQLADKLKNEGLFDPTRKKPLPRFPQTIAIVTADRSAALEDIKNTLDRRSPQIRKLFYPVPVQGDNAAPKIAKAIKHLNALNNIDLIILARGGGSIEDLWAFNEEVLARAMAQSQIPIITGVGHEIDITIADMVADQRAATPTAAAELAVPVRNDLLQALAQTQQRLAATIAQRHDQEQQKLNALASRPLFTRPADAIGFRHQTLDEQQATLATAITQTLRNTERNLDARLTTLRQIEPHNALRRGESQLAQKIIDLNTISPQRQIQPATLKLHHLTDRLTRSQTQSNQNHRQQVNQLAKQLNALNPRNVLDRGYSITTSKTTGKIITKKNKPKSGDTITTEFADKQCIESTVTKTPAS